MNNYIKNDLEEIALKVKELNELYKHSSEFNNTIKTHIKSEEQNYINILINIFHTETSNIRMTYFFCKNINLLTNAIDLISNLTLMNQSRTDKLVVDEYLNSYKSCYISLKNEYGEFIKGAFSLELSDIIGESKVTPIWDGIFTNESNFKKFYDYKSNHIIEIYVDYSYLFQRMLFEKIIYRIRHKEFINWLSRFELIKDSEYHKLNEKGGFLSLLKSSSIQRTNNFNIVFKI